MKRLIPLIVISILLAACGGSNQPVPVSGDGIDDSSAPAPTLTPTAIPENRPVVFTPAPIPNEITPDLALLPGAMLPEWIEGVMPHTGMPDGLEAMRAGDYRSTLDNLAIRGLVPVTQGGVALSYRGEDGRQYFPMVETIGDIKTGLPMTVAGFADEIGVITYSTEDGMVSKQFLVSLVCPEGMTCVQVVSFNLGEGGERGDAGTLYFLMLDEKGQVVRHVASGVAAKAVAEGQDIPWVAGVSPEWQTVATGWEAMGQIGPKDLRYDDQTGEFSFDVDGKQVTAKQYEVELTTDFGAIVQSNEGTFVWDINSKRFVAASEVVDESGVDYGLWQVGEKNFVIIDGYPRWVTEVTGLGSDELTITLDDGQEMTWDRDRWKVIEVVNMTFEEWKKVLSGPYITMSGKESSPGKDKWDFFEVGVPWGVAEFYTDPTVVEQLPSDTVLLVLKPTGEIVVWASPEEAAQMMVDGATVFTTTSPSPISQVLVSVRAANEQLSVDGGAKIWITFRENNSISHSKLAYKLIEILAGPVDSNGNLTNPAIPVPPEHFKVVRYDDDGTRIVEEYGEFKNPERWLQELVDAGYTAIEILPHQ